MEEKVLETLVTSFTQVLLKESKELISDLSGKIDNEIKQFIGRDLKKYLNKHREKYSKVKTLLKGNTPVYLYDIYFPLKLVKEKEVISTNSVSSLFSDFNYITIIGDAGSGKSTLVKHLFLNSIAEKYKIPILVELRYLNEDNRSISDYIREIASMNKLSVNSEILERYLMAGKFIFFLDGYDELESKTKKSVVKDLNEFISIYDENNFILTSRPYSNIEHLPLFSNYYMKDLEMDKGEIKGFIFKQLDEREIAEKIYKSIESSHSEYIGSFLRNPLLLSLYILTFQSYASIPDKKYIFYRRVVNALFSEHDSKTKLGFVREKASGLNQEQFEKVLKSFSFLSYFESQFNFDRDYVYEKLELIKSKNEDLVFENNNFINDLRSAIALWVDDDGELSFTHRSLQEFFAALFIKQLNKKENNRVYSKILEKLVSDHKFHSREIENILDLLSEMDEINYKKNFYLPLLLKFQRKLDMSSDEALVKSFILFLTGGLTIRTNLKQYHEDSGEYLPIPVRPQITDMALYTAKFHIGSTRKLYKYLELKYKENLDMLYAMGEEKEGLLSELKRKGMRFIRFKKNLPDEIFNILYSKELIDISKDYVKFLNREINETETFLDKSLSNEKDMVDLI